MELGNASDGRSLWPTCDGGRGAARTEAQIGWMDHRQLLIGH